jgi:hypothetical protein
MTLARRHLREMNHRPADALEARLSSTSITNLHYLQVPWGDQRVAMTASAGLSGGLSGWSVA